MMFTEAFSLLLQYYRTEKEINRRKDTVGNLRSKANQMASVLDNSSANRDSLLGPEIKPDAMSRTVGLDNQGLVGLQRHIMKGKLKSFQSLTFLMPFKSFFIFLRWNFT